MATTTVHTGEAGVYLYIEYSFSADKTARTWTCNAALKVHVTSSRTIGPWVNTSANTATLQGGAIGSLNNTNYTLVASKKVASGSYNAAGDAPKASVSWCWNVNSSWGGFVNPHGTATLTGTAIGPVTPTEPDTPEEPEEPVNTAAVHIKVNGAWKSGVPWVKVNGVWKRATAVFTKVNGTWKRSV